MKRAFFYKDEKSDKFWAIHAEGEAFAVHYGKTGTAGKFDIKEFGDADECAKAAEKLIRSKQAKGYKEAPDFDFSAQIYIDTDEIGPHRLSSHPRFAAHFTDDFYYDCGDEEAPFGSDEGSDTLNLLEEYIRKNRNGDIVYFPQRVMEKDWGMEYIPPDFFDEAGIKAEIAKPDDAIPRSQLLTINDQVIIATALGQIKIMGEVSQRLKVHAQNAL
ncbi:MAG: WGR domain-containing protein, partial [Gracilibacteraceae bacterium]|nr:WGR domain-containing protein [Gracilibacteraceae bacterium]